MNASDTPAPDAPETDYDYEFDADELAARPKTIVAIYGGPTWHLTDTYDEVEALKEATLDGDEIECNAHQEGGLPPARIKINPNLVATTFEITEDRWKADRLERHKQELAMRQAQARGGIAVPPPGGMPLN